jgi:hypothetical protein
MGSKPAAVPTQTTTPIITPQQQEVMDLALPGVRSFAANVPKRYEGTQTAGFDPSQTAAQEQLLGGAAPAQQGLVDKGAQTSNFWLGGDVWNPETNKNLQGAIGAATRPITQAYQETVLPGIRSDATGDRTRSSRRGCGVCGEGL